MFMYGYAKRVMLALLLVCIAAGVSSAAPKYKWSLASPWSRPLSDKEYLFFIEKVKEYTNGDIEITLHPNSLLGTHDETFHGVRDGNIEMAVLCPYVNLVPGGMLNWMPWTITTFDEARIAYSYPDGILFKVMQEAWREVNGELLFTASEGGYGLANNVRPLRKPEDLKNLKMRVSSSLAYVMALENMGAGSGMTLETIPWAELYNSFSRGVVDGCWDMIPSLIDDRHAEVLKHFTLGAMGGWQVLDIIVNRELWDSLEPKYQDALRKAGIETEQRICSLYEAEEARYLQNVRSNYPNFTLTELTPEEMSVWREKSNMPKVWVELANPWLDKVWPGENMGDRIRAELDSIRERAAKKK
jgi:TRAP-type C4-dicarboxylate transport system substrate-binding protein